MANVFSRLFAKKDKVQPVEKDVPGFEDNEEVDNKNEYEDDIQDAANLALAMQQGDDTTNYELTLSWESLPKMDALSLTDAMIVVYIEHEGEYKEIGKTEVINNSLDPKFGKNFIVSYSQDNPEQKIKFDIYDVDNEKEKDVLEKQEYIGGVEFALRDIVLTPGESYKRDLCALNKNGKKKMKNLGKLIVKAFESDIGQSKMWFVIGVDDFITRNFISFTIKGSSNNKEYFVIHNSPKKKNSQKGCIFPRFSVNSNKIHDENPNLKFEFFEIKKTSTKLLGEVEISLVGLNNDSNKKINIYRNNLIVGKMRIIELIKEKKNTFLNYIYEGYCLKCIFAVDMTLKKEGERSLKNPENLAVYKDAVKQIGTLLKFYDDDPRTVSMGFGAKLPPYFSVVSHWYGLNGNYFDPAIDGLEGITDALSKSIDSIEFHGPTIISEIIKYGSEIARMFKERDPKQYLILVILTDGEITDIKATKEAIFQAESLPISILWAGIGKKKFTKLKTIKLNDKGNNNYHTMEYHHTESKRNVFHYIKYNKLKDSQEKIATNTFAEIPKQFLEYMKLCNITTKRVKDNKKENTKREIKRKMANRKWKNMTKKHLIVSYLEEQKEKFVKSIKALGYKPEIVDEVIKTGVPAMDYNLIAELISQKQKELKEIDDKPIFLKNLDDKEESLLDQFEDNKGNYSDRDSQLKAYEDADDAKVDPEKVILFTKDKIPNKKSKEWMNKKNETHTATQNLLLNRENEETNYWEDNLPQILIDKFRNKKEIMKQKETKENISLFGKSDKLDPFLDKEKIKYDSRYGTKTKKEKICILWNKEEISIIFMNCGHAIWWSRWRATVQDNCPLWGVPISYWISASNAEYSDRFSRQLSSINDDEFDKESNIMEINPNVDFPIYKNKHKKGSSRSRSNNEMSDDESMPKREEGIKKSIELKFPKRINKDKNSNKKKPDKNQLFNDNNINKSFPTENNDVEDWLKEKSNEKFHEFHGIEHPHSSDGKNDDSDRTSKSNSNDDDDSFDKGSGKSLKGIQEDGENDDEEDYQNKNHNKDSDNESDENITPTPKKNNFVNNDSKLPNMNKVPKIKSFTNEISKDKSSKSDKKYEERAQNNSTLNIDDPSKKKLTLPHFEDSQDGHDNISDLEEDDNKNNGGSYYDDEKSNSRSQNVHQSNAKNTSSLGVHKDKDRSDLNDSILYEKSIPHDKDLDDSDNSEGDEEHNNIEATEEMKSRSDSTPKDKVIQFRIPDKKVNIKKPVSSESGFSSEFDEKGFGEKRLNDSELEESSDSLRKLKHKLRNI